MTETDFEELKRKMWDHIEYVGDEVYKPKPQYMRGVHVFTCPLCGEKISSSTYLNTGYFQIAIEAHIEEHELRQISQRSANTPVRYGFVATVNKGEERR